MSRFVYGLFGACALMGALLTTGCGPGLLALGGGGSGTYFGLQGGGDDGKGGGSTPAPNVAPAVIITSVVRGDSPVAVHYTVIDPDGDLCTLEMQYSLNGVDYNDCFVGVGGDGVIDLSSSASGIAHTFRWDFVADLGSGEFVDGITIRARANDGEVTGSWNEQTGVSLGNNPPSVDNIQFSNTSGIVLFTFNLFDDNFDACSFDISYSVDQGQNWIPVQPNELLGNPPVNLATSPTGTPSQFIWDSNVALLDFMGDIQMLFTPKDHPPGYAEVTVGPSVVNGPYLLDNSVNNPPVLTINSALDGNVFVARVPVEISLADEESDPSAVDVEFSLDNGQNWSAATLVNQFIQGVAGPFPTSPNPSTRNLVWNALADIAQLPTYQNTWPGVLLRMTPRDGQAGVALESEGFTVVGNTAPEVTSVEALQTGGSIALAIVLRDERSDAVSVLIEYGTDGVNFSPLAAGDFLPQGDNPASLESSSTGKGNQVIWDTTLRFPNANAANVYLRVTPTDHPDGATPVADLAGQAFLAPPFPVINDPAGADPASINVFTTDTGGTPTTNPLVTVAAGGVVYLDRAVSPQSSTVQDTFWKIAESGTAWGELQVVDGSNLAYATGGFTLHSSVTFGDTLRLHDGLSDPVIFEFWDGAAPVSNQPVDIAGMTTLDQIGAALEQAINAHPEMRITAVHIGAGVFNLTHDIACRVGNAASIDTLRGNAMDIVGTPTTILDGPATQLSGGDGTQRVRYAAPATPPGGSQFIDLVCVIDHASFLSVERAYRLHWGAPVNSVSIIPPSTTRQVGGQVNMTAVIDPVGAPQIASWEVVGGSANGTIVVTGPATATYTAPATLPGTTLLTVTVRAYSIDPLKAPGNATVFVQPEPSTITVSTTGSGSLLLGASRQYTAVVNPPAASQQVNWTVFWNGQDRGSGDSQVGTINTSGLYTAPQSLISPAEVFIRATSQVKPSVAGSYSQSLHAPAPTSFGLSPSGTVNVTAGGAGVQFSALNFQPSNANTSVTWELSAPTGTISGNGFYEPPSTASQPLTVTVRARSSAPGASSVTATAQVNIAQNVFTPPTSVTVTPDTAYSHSAGVPIQFSRVVSPPAASQAVTWAILSGGGSIDSSGLFTPPQTNVDTLVTVLCATVANPSINRQVTIRVAGDGRDWHDSDALLISRGQPNMVWDSHNARMWVIGGRNPLSGATAHTRATLTIDTAAGRVLGAGPTIGGAAYLGAEPVTIAAAFDSGNNRLIAILGKSGGGVEMWQLNATQVGQSPGPEWTPLLYTTSASSALPSLGKSHTYHCWYEPGKAQLHLLFSRSWLYTFDCTSNNWTSRVTLGGQTAAPVIVEYCGHAWDGSSSTHYFVGPTDGTNTASTRLFGLSTATTSWINHSPQNGPLPAYGLANPSVTWVGDRVHVYGGQRLDTGEFVDTLYTARARWDPGLIGIGAHWEADWTVVPRGTGEVRPLPRGDAGFAAVGSAYLLMGGEVGKGTFGDLWEYRPGLTPPFIAYTATGIRPEGRGSAAGAIVSGAIYTYGGMANHGACNDLWRYNYNATTKAGTWTRLAPGTSTQLPPPLHGATMVHDAHNNRLLLFGGDEAGTGTPAYSDRLFSYNIGANTWNLLSPGGTRPSPRRGAAMCYDKDNRRIWLFGGEDAGGRLNDLHYLDVSSGLPGTWVTVGGMTGSIPDPRMFATLGWDTINARLLLIGGDSSVSGANSQLFEFRPQQTAWSPLSIGNAGQHEPVAYSGAVWDDLHARFVHAPAGRSRAQAVVLATPGANWQFLTPPPNSNTTGSTGLYDPVDQRYYVLFGERAAGAIGLNGVRSVEFKQGP